MLYVILWIVLWSLIGYFLSKRSTSKIITIGGSLIASIFAFAIIIVPLSIFKDKQHNAELPKNITVVQDKAAQKKQKQAEKQADLRVCRASFKCWSQKNSGIASVLCTQAIERLARYDFKWDSWVLSDKFKHAVQYEKNAAAITYIGDRIVFQNGFGANVRYIYRCTFDTEKRIIINVSAEPGRL